MRFSTFISAAAFFELSIAGYVLEDDYMTDFFGAFDFFTGSDPTEGFVQFVDEDTARQTNLINGSSTTKAQWGVDTQNKTPDGRPSIRIESKKKYNSGLIVLDVEHMPFGCGTWPAFWTLGPNWPKNGEIDIIEGVNAQTNNGMTLHTGPGCQIGQDTTAQFSGTVTTGNCDVAAEDQGKNVGCSIENTSEKSYGAGLNAIGGGVYATQWASDAISIYFFPRDSIPADALGENPDPSGWGIPAAKFTGGCDIEETFKEQMIVFDTTFCGQWAGSEDVWEGGSCAKKTKTKTCDEYVRDNPEAFTEAYWTINALKVYQDSGEAPASPAPSTPAESTAISGLLPIPTLNSSVSAGVPAISSVLSYPVDVPTTSTPVAIPSATGSILAPVPTSSAVPAVPSDTTAAPAAPLPTNGTSPGVSSEVPGVTQTQSEASSASPTKPIGSPVAAPTGGNSGNGTMGGFQWPVGDGQSDDEAASSTTAASPSQGTGAPAQNSTSTVVAPSEVKNVALPSTSPVAEAAAAPTGGNGTMGDFQWPAGGDSQPDDTPAATTTAASPSQGTDAPAQNSTAGTAAPSGAKNIAQPTNGPVVEAPANANDAPSVCSSGAGVHTVYETVYASPTPAAAAQKARMARHIRDHRQKLTRHNARQ